MIVTCERCGIELAETPPGQAGPPAVAGWWHRREDDGSPDLGANHAPIPVTYRVRWNWFDAQGERLVASVEKLNVLKQTGHYILCWNQDGETIVTSAYSTEGSPDVALMSEYRGYESQYALEPTQQRREDAKKHVEAIAAALQDLGWYVRTDGVIARVGDSANELR